MEILNKREDFLEVLEADLIQKVKDSVKNKNIEGNVYGVFSLDDLENKNADDLGGGIAFGVGYQGLKPITEHAAQLNPGKSNAVQQCDVFFAILIAAPVNEFCNQRLTAHRLLTILRQGILGKSVVEGVGPASRNSIQRAWVFVQEKPEVGESDEKMLYYTQVWRLVLPMTGN
jgi:hypothetical protein